MHWMWDAMWARIGWALGELALLVAILVVAFVGVLLWAAYVGWKQSRCQHAKTHELPSSPARQCDDCGLKIWPEMKRVN